MKKLNLLSVALFALTWFTGSSAMAWDEPTQVDGVYQIGTASELEWFSDYVAAGNTTIKGVLTADIDMTGVTHSPIGPSTGIKYNGEFDGQGHCIKNMVINNTSENQGLFGCVRGGTTIKNIIIDKTCSVTCKNRAGALIGTVQTKVSGTTTPILILNCVNQANVTATDGVASAFIGAGQSEYPYIVIHNCINTGNITGASNNYATVAIGWNSQSCGNSQVWNVANTGTISPIQSSSMFFRGNYRSVSNCYDLSGSGQTGQVTSYTADTSDPLHSGELCWRLNNMLTVGTSQGTAFTQDLSDPTSIPLPVASGKTVYQVAALDCAGNAKGAVTYSNTEGGTKDDHVYVNGICSVCKAAVQEDWMTASADGYYHLSTPEQVEWFSHMVRDAKHGAMNAKLDADIDFGSVADAHLPIGASGQKYFGHFDGQNHRIKNMVLTTGSTSQLVNRGYDGQGFFGSVRGGGTDANGTITNEAIIENLIIDASCSIKHDNNFAAGIVAHINSSNNTSDSHNCLITIQNCGNEANVESTGKNIAGILGCVEATEVGLKIINCWNKGKITGSSESAAICGWAGTPKDYLTKEVKGCWNIGEVTGIDGNGYNMIRAGKLNDALSPALNNVVDLCITNSGNQGKVSVLNTDAPIASGELCYLLNGDQSDIVYTQTLGTDEMPVYGTTSKQVYQAGTVDCLGAAVGAVNYNNVSGETITLDHQISDEIGMCSVCHTQFQEPDLVDGYYQIKNAGNLEWFANYINTVDITKSAMLMNDIDMLGIENLHTPIGNTEAMKFNGTFDGQGHRIKNLIINRPAVSYQGIFGYFRGNANNTTVKNLIIDKSCSIHGYNRVGGLVGAYQNGGMTITVENVVNEADVTAEHQDAGGIFGGHVAGNPIVIIKNVVNTGNITAKNEYPYAGALCCYMGVDATSKIENFLNIGTVTGHNGGNIGRHNMAEANVSNLIDLSETTDKTQGVVDGLTAEDVTNGKVAYIMGMKQLIGTDEYPSPFNTAEVKYVGDAGYATMVAASDSKLNGNAQAYIGAKNPESGLFKLTEVADIPAGKAVVLKGTYYNTIATTATSDFSANELKAATEDVTADGTQYILAKSGDVVGFYKATTGTTIAAGKGYITSDSGVKAFILSDDENATAISNLNADVNTSNAIYNLAGQRISKMQKGINIVNGKKFLK